jgi:hypothetical protein
MIECLHEVCIAQVATRGSSLDLILYKHARQSQDNTAQTKILNGGLYAYVAS